MAYDEFLADRIKQLLNEKSVSYRELKMMGGLCFMIDEKMCCGLLTDKTTDTALLMARIGTDNYEVALQKPHCSEMNFTGRSMKGYVFISEDGFDMDEDLNYWIQLCIDHNPFAKSSKKKAKKK